MKLLEYQTRDVIEVCVSTISATLPVPVTDDAYQYLYPTKSTIFD